MKSAYALLLLAKVALGGLLVSFSAENGDDPSVLGTRDLEAARGVTQSQNTDDLFIKLGADPNGRTAAHFHRKEGDIRAEYHCLNGKTAAGYTYFIGYSFAVREVEESLMIWQFKEYVANNPTDGGANIPLAMEIVDGELQFQYQASASTGRIKQWSTPITAETNYKAGIVINTSTPGWVRLYWNGELQRLGDTGTTNLTATTFPGRADPKFGAYRGEAVGIDTYVYDIAIGTSLADIKPITGIN